MRSERTVLPVAIGAGITGWMVARLYAGDSVTAGDLLNAGVTVAIGWWIQETLRRSAELDRVPLDAVGRQCRRIEEKLGECVRPRFVVPGTDKQLTEQLRDLSNEVYCLGSYVEQFCTSFDGYDALKASMREIKVHLAETLGAPDFVSANVARGLSGISCVRRFPRPTVMTGAPL